VQTAVASEGRIVQRSILHRLENKRSDTAYFTKMGICFGLGMFAFGGGVGAGGGGMQRGVAVWDNAFKTSGKLYRSCFGPIYWVPRG